MDLFHFTTLLCAVLFEVLRLLFEEVSYCCDKGIKVKLIDGHLYITCICSSFVNRRPVGSVGRAPGSRAGGRGPTLKVFKLTEEKALPL